MKNFDPLEEHVIGKLCEQGLLKESWSEEENDLIRTVTEKGEKEFKELIKDPYYKNKFIEYLAIHINQLQ